MIVFKTNDKNFFKDQTFFRVILKKSGNPSDSTDFSGKKA